nr:MAG TPA: hypothetical protein [Caudoviricetes sp.]
MSKSSRVAFNSFTSFTSYTSIFLFIPSLIQKRTYFCGTLFF